MFHEIFRIGSLITCKLNYCISSRTISERISLKSASLQKLLNLKPHEAECLLLKCKRLRFVDEPTLFDNFKKLRTFSITRKMVVKYPNLLAISDVQSRLEWISKLRFNVNDSCPLLNIPLQQMLIFNPRMIEEKIDIMSKQLEVNTEQCCHLLSEKTFILKSTNELLSKKISILLGYGISSSDILKDLWVLRYSEQTIIEKLDVAKSKNISKPKTWMVRATPEIFENYLRRQSEYKSILGNNSLVEYLSGRLGCAESEVTEIVAKHPAIKKKSLTKLNEIIAFLYSQGFKSYHICRVPKILLHGIETTKKRMQQLTDNGLHIDSLYSLTKSTKQFNEVYEILLRNKAKHK